MFENCQLDSMMMKTLKWCNPLAKIYDSVQNTDLEINNHFMLLSGHRILDFHFAGMKSEFPTFSGMIGKLSVLVSV